MKSELRSTRRDSVSRANHEGIIEVEGFSMLILTRRVGETVMIGDEVTVTVLGCRGTQVRVGINAPKTVAVHREEVYERIKREQYADRPDETKQPPDSDADFAQEVP